MGLCPPRFATRRRLERESFGDEIATIAELLGTPLMPWQRLVADVAGERLPDGRPAYREVVVTVPRQQGKTLLIASFLLHRTLMWGSRQLAAYTAQTGRDGRDKWLDELIPMVMASPLRTRVDAVVRANGNEALRIKGGGLIRVMSTAEGAGHGKTWNLAVMDEIWHDVDDRREQSLRPAMIRVPDAQLLVCSTAGTAASTVYNRKVAHGRLAVAEDTGTGVAYFEWSAPDDWNPADEDSWPTFLPALADGVISPDVIRSERQSMEPGEFKRAYGNRPTAGVDMVIPEGMWRASCDPNAEPGKPLRFGVDVAEDRSSAAIVAFGGGVFELIEHRPGIGWVAARCKQLTKAHGGTVAMDYAGPGGVLADKIDKVEKLQARDVQQACAGLYDAIVEGKVKFRTDPRFDAAVEGAVKKPVGDVWVWSRKGSMADVTPLVAATVAHRAPEKRTGLVVGIR